MLESVILKGAPGSNNVVDAGILAEALIYYDRVRLIITPGNMSSLIKGLGRDMFHELVANASIDLTVIRGLGATMNTPTAQGTAFRYVVMQFGGRQPKELSDAEYLAEFLHRNTNSRGWSRDTAKKIVDRATTLNLDAPFPSGHLLTKTASDDAASPQLLQRYVGEMLPTIAPGYQPPEGWMCRAVPHNGGYLFESNLDWSAMNEAFLASRPGEKELQVGHLVNGLMELHEDLYIQSHLDGDLQSGDVGTNLIRIRIDGAVERVLRTREQVAHFQDALMPNGRKLREAVNAGEVDFKDVMKLRAKRRKFGEWLKGQQPSDDLLTAYFDEVYRPSPLGSLPVKPVRWCMFTGIGAAIGAMASPAGALALGTAASMFDTFLYDRLAKGWRPNQFVEKVYKLMKK